MLKKFLTLFTKWKSRDCGNTPKVQVPWPVNSGQPRRVSPDRDVPFKTGTPHSRMHDLILSGKPDALIAIELGVEISAVRTYRHIISAKAREAARWRAVQTGLVEGSCRLGMSRKARVPAALLRQYRKPTDTETIRESPDKCGGLDYGQFGYPSPLPSSCNSDDGNRG